MPIEQTIAKTDWKLQVEGLNAQYEAEAFELGPCASYALIHDPKRLGFVLSRYKFCAKMLEGKESALEVGCGDGFGIPIMAQAVGRLHCLDWNDPNLQSVPQRLAHLKNVTYGCLDVTKDQPKGTYDAAYSIDVLQHIEPEREAAFFRHLCASLSPAGVFVVGTPNKMAAPHASPQGQAQFINLKTAPDLRALLSRYFINTFVFSMNDEVIHTGYHPMAQYLFAIGAGIRPADY